MPARRAVAAALLGVVLLAGSAQGAGRVQLDGQKRTKHSYAGQLDGSTTTSAGANGNTTSATAPRPSDCTKTSCDVSTLVLTVPRGRQSGRFSYDAQFQGLLGEPSFTTLASVGLYDARGVEVLASAVCCTRIGGLHLSHARLPSGVYKLIIYNQGGPTRFTATMNWLANPRHRSA